MLRARHASLTLAALLAAPVSGVAQGGAGDVTPDTIDARVEPADAYGDPEVGRLLSRARAARTERAAGLGAFELTFRERVYAGLGGALVRRERALYHQERAARVHWSKSGDRVVRWLGVRRGVPIAGLRVEFEDDPRTDDAFDLDFDFLDPAEDRVFLGSEWALHPLADSAAFHYRFRSGDTLRIRFPGADRTVTLVEATVEPREARFDRIVGSLWFDAETAVLARAVYRPAIDYDFDREEPEDADEVPGFVKPIRADVDYITVDYGLQELRWWLPNRMAFDGTATIGGIARMPVRFEWSFEDYLMNAPQALDPGEALPEGWTRWEKLDEDEEDAGEEDAGTEAEGSETERTEAGGAAAENPTAVPDSLAEERRAVPDSLAEPPRRVVVIVPPADSLLRSPELPEPLFSARVQAFDAAELDELTSRLEGLRVPGAALPPPRFAAPGLLPGLWRYNRVEGFSPGVRLELPTGSASRLEVTARVGIPEWEPGAEVGWSRETARGSFGLTVYRRLIDLGDWGRPLSFGNSLNTLLFGYDFGLYYRETGAELFGSRTGARFRWEGRLFAERHQTAPKTANASLPDLIDERILPENLAAERGEIVGAGGRVRFFSGVDREGAIVSGTVWGEGATGDFDYARLAASTAVSAPLLGRLIGALEVAGGTTFGEPPLQRRFHLGGPHTLRGFEVGTAAGEAFWLARAELGLGLRVSPAEYARAGGALRLVVFGDAAWAGPRADFGTEGYKLGVGAGLSAMDGLFRLDLARGVRGGNDWRLLIYMDGIL